MGLGGHILGPKKLRALERLTGLRLARAYNRNGYCEGVYHGPDGCKHYAIDLKTGHYEENPNPVHWTSCPAGSQPRLDLSPIGPGGVPANPDALARPAGDPCK